MHRLVYKCATNYLIEVLSNTVSHDISYYLRTNDNIKQFKLHAERIMRGHFAHTMNVIILNQLLEIYHVLMLSEIKLLLKK